MAERRAFGQDDLYEAVQAEEGPAAEQSIGDRVTGLRYHDFEPANQNTIHNIAAYKVEESAPDPAHTRDFPALGAAACIDLVAARQYHHKHIGDLPANSSAHGVADQVLNISKPVGTRINPEQRGELARFIEQAQQKREQDRAFEIQLKVVSHVYAKRDRQQDVEQELPQGHACHVCSEVFYAELSIVPVEPDLLAGNQVKMVLPPVSDR